MPVEDDGGPGLRERKKRETRTALSRAAIRLSLERGWDKVTVDDIAAAANVSSRTFRNYFTTKAEAIAAGHFERMLRIADGLRARPSAEPLWEAIGNAVAAQFRPEKPTHGKPLEAKRWMKGIRFVLTEPAIQGEVLKATAKAQDEMAKAIAERTGADLAHDTYPQLTAAVVAAGMGVAVGRWLRGGPAGSVVPLLREVFGLISSGLPVPASTSSSRRHR
jgi:AcrR family transcriptional regulator